jgi:hypothetical protein
MHKQKRSRKIPDGFTKCNLPFGPVYGPMTPDGRNGLTPSDSFVARRLNKAGTMVFMEDGKTYLVGHINRLAGVCDDCKAFENEARVLGYKVVVECGAEKKDE